MCILYTASDIPFEAVSFVKNTDKLHIWKVKKIIICLKVISFDSIIKKTKRISQ